MKGLRGLMGLKSWNLDPYQINRGNGDLDFPEPLYMIRGDAMSDAHSADEKVPMMQQLLDNPFLLLFLGVMVPMLVYTLWGVIDILTVPLAK